MNITQKELKKLLSFVYILGILSGLIVGIILFIDFCFKVLS